MDSTAFFKLTYGLYVVSTEWDKKDYGCVVNTVAQVTSEPAKLSVAINKNGATAQAILQSGKFAAVVLTESADMNLIGAFGFRTSTEKDKFADFKNEKDQNGIRYLTEHTAARYSCKVEQTIDVGSHILFIGEVQEAENLGSEPVMTYAYYHSVVKGKTPKNAPSFQPAKPAQEPKNEGTRWQCKICGYIYEGEEIPDGYTCPICGAGKDQFEKV